MKSLIIIGAGGYAKSVLDSVDYMNFKMEGFLDDIKPIGTEHLGYPIIGNKVEDIEHYKNYVFFVAIGNNAKRKLWFEKLKLYDLSLINVIDHSAIVSKYATMGEGCFVGKLAILNHGCIVGDNCVVNTRALVEHGCNIHNHVNLSTNSTLNGDVIVEEGGFIGSGTVINGQITVGKWALVGSGAVVIRDVKSNTTVVGVPAKEIISNSHKYNSF
ncbi:acetyltransferase [Hoylesella pleuritidis]|uniref:acetyltransferase n=1 Tax=Hoylesella pleuritidis TaxID=407975 RepID=UPI0004685536|nr:acetyltransferase [Hoylesella pleuritidis]